jgi:hypothetical protein
VEVAERYADGQATDQERAAACAAAWQLDWQITREEGTGNSAREMANCATASAANDSAALGPCADQDLTAAEDSALCTAATVEYRFTRATHPSTTRRLQAQQAAHADELAVQAGLLHCVFGNPFRPVAIAPSWLDWRDGLVRQLAEAAYQERQLPGGTLDRDCLAVLADALEEAGCQDADILAHLRQPGPHYRGCWVLDLVTGRE